MLEAIYEQDFLPCSHGFRPKRGAHKDPVDDHVAPQSHADSGHRDQFSRDRVLPQDTALKGAAEEKSTPETLTTACQAASWLARS